MMNRNGFIFHVMFLTRRAMLFHVSFNLTAFALAFK